MLYSLLFSLVTKKLLKGWGFFFAARRNNTSKNFAATW
jgi:hypothetical protein